MQMKKLRRDRDSLSGNIRKVTLSRITGLYFRLVFLKRKNEILATQGSFTYGGRYNPEGEFGALYLGESAEVCRAERKKQTKDFFLEAQILGKIKVSYKKVLDLTDPGTLKKLGIKKEEILGEEKDGGWNLTWEIARLAYQCGIEAILAPSITGTGNNLIVFDKHLESGKIKLVAKQREEVEEFIGHKQSEKLLRDILHSQD